MKYRFIDVLESVLHFYRYLPPTQSAAWRGAGNLCGVELEGCLSKTLKLPFLLFPKMRVFQTRVCCRCICSTRFHPIGVPRGASKGEDDGRRSPALRSGHPCNGCEAISGVVHPQGVERFGMVGPSHMLGSPWPPLAIHPCIFPTRCRLMIFRLHPLWAKLCRNWDITWNVFQGLSKPTQTPCPAGGHPWTGLQDNLGSATQRASLQTSKRLCVIFDLIPETPESGPTPRSGVFWRFLSPKGVCQGVSMDTVTYR
jgi:hypothetical protein